MVKTPLLPVNVIKENAGTNQHRHTALSILWEQRINQSYYSLKL